ncbi:hypothetical protein VaNZ11_003094 [Volvox africanus]|uniref:BAH domain-containing protein n=1 Tax=Volvox africanus TaxID=51714 RepID=A0ABQ5RUX7_9CHLO|nr:hypothetical protein VaNZ11_003094 [Volvox africanus]
MRKYAEAIRQYGMTDLTSTGPKESYNKTLRAAWQFTNKKNDALQEQVVGKLGLVAPCPVHDSGADMATSDNACSRVISSKTHAMGRTGLTLPWLEACQRFSSAGAVDGAKYLTSCLSKQLKDIWGLSQSQLELCQVTVRQICYLYYTPYETVVYVRGGRLTGTLFGNRTEAAVCDVSVRSNEDGVWYGRVQLLLSITHTQDTHDLVYVRWFEAPEEDWNREVHLRPLQWYRKPGAPHASCGCIPLESVIERVCIFRTPRPIVGKRGASDMKPVDPKDDDKTSQFVLINLVGPPAEELLPVVAEAVREEGMGMQLRPCQVSVRLGAAMAAMEVKAWGWEPLRLSKAPQTQIRVIPSNKLF